LQANSNDLEIHEFICVKHTCRYGSIHGDGHEVVADLCQHCFEGMCGDILTITPNSSCDIDVDVKNILSVNKIFNEEGVKKALKRVGQLWDAQYHSAEGNELHRLVELICTYENISSVNSID
jgi:hypothetical protein